jgi:hypothetical protein
MCIWHQYSALDTLSAIMSPFRLLVCTDLFYRNYPIVDRELCLPYRLPPQCVRELQNNGERAALMINWTHQGVSCVHGLTHSCPFIIFGTEPAYHGIEDHPDDVFKTEVQDTFQELYKI